MKENKVPNKVNKIVYGAIALLTALSCLFLVGIIDNSRNIRALDNSKNTSSENENPDHLNTEGNSAGDSTEKTSETRTESETNSKPDNTIPDPTPQPTEGKIVYLTFDDGPSPVTDRVLDILDRYNVKATFFVIYSKNHSDKLLDIHNRGHAIGLHTYTHDYSEIYASTDAFFKDLQKISDHVEEIVGITPKIARFPGGSSNQVSKQYSPGIMTKLSSMVKEKGYVYFDWNCENGDGNGNNISPGKLLEKVKATTPREAKEVCVLMHDAGSKSTTADSLPGVIEYFRDAGYEFKTITTKTSPVRHAVAN